MQYTISYDANPKDDDTKRLLEGISLNAKLIKEHEPGKSFGFFIKDNMGMIYGGCSGYLFYGCLYVDMLWVDISLRGQRFGTRLMRQSEQLAKENGCHFLAVNTMDFEALPFYQKLGFAVEFERHGFSKHSIMYFLRKNL